MNKMANVNKLASNESHLQAKWKIQSSSTARKRQNRPKVQNEWKPQHIELLINTVERHSSLWDKNHEDYKLPKTNAWQSVSQCLPNYSAEECKAKWNNLRVTFNTNFSKYIGPNRIQDSDDSAPKWKYFNSLLFLKAENPIKRNYSNCSIPSVMMKAAIPATPSPTVPNYDNSRKRKAARSPPLTPIPLPSVSPCLSLSPSLVNSVSPSPSLLKPLSVKSYNEAPMRPVEYINANRDEFGFFGDFIVAELRGLPRDRAAYVKRKLMRHFVDLMDEVAECMAPTSHQGNNY